MDVAEIRRTSAFCFLTQGKIDVGFISPGYFPAKNPNLRGKKWSHFKPCRKRFLVHFPKRHIGESPSGLSQRQMRLVECPFEILLEGLKDGLTAFTRRSCKFRTPEDET